MGEKTAIQWCDHTFNPWWGCAHVSPGCDHCYAAAWARRTGHAVWGPHAPRRFFDDDHWREPLRWDAKARRDGVRRRVFCGSMCDWAEVRVDLCDHQRRLCAMVEETPYLDWLLLTKRPQNVPRAVPASWMRAGFPRNAWPGTTIENKELLSKRADYLAALPAAIRFLSLEPLLEPVDLTDWIGPANAMWDGDFESSSRKMMRLDKLSWVIVGGESGPKARPFDLVWARKLRDQCRVAGVRFYMKQIGAITVDSSMAEKDGTPGLIVGIRDKKGANPAEWEPGLRVREFPEVTR